MSKKLAIYLGIHISIILALLVAFATTKDLLPNEIMVIVEKILLYFSIVSLIEIILIFIGLYVHEQILFKNYLQHYSKDKAELFQDLIHLDDDAFLNKFKDHFASNIDYNTEYDGKPLIDYLLKYRKYNTLMHFIRNNATIDGYEKEIEKHLPLTYSIVDRFHYNFSDYFEDRI